MVARQVFESGRKNDAVGISIAPIDESRYLIAAIGLSRGGPNFVVK
jgi:hypothetical protein